MEQKKLKKIVFLVDDDTVTNMINEKLITRGFDFEVRSYTSASAALDDLQKLSTSIPGTIPDMIFLDINMPVMDGWEFLEKFKAFPESLFGNCKIFMLTSSIDIDDIDKAKTYGAISEFISKPLTIAKIKVLTAGEPSVVT